MGQVVAHDEDQGVNGLVTYTVISDWANDVFSLNPQSGVFTLTARLDYEEVSHLLTLPTFHLGIVADLWNQYRQTLQSMDF